MDASATASLDQRVAAVRRFSRFYTRVIGALQEGLLQSRFSLAEARVLYELAQRAEPTATELGRDLEMDAGYLSRILQRVRTRRPARPHASGTDRRQSLLSLTDGRREAFAPLDARSRAEWVLCSLRCRSPRSPICRRHAAHRDTAGVLPTRRSGCCASTGLATSAGSLPGTPRCMPRNTHFDHRFEALVAQVAGDFLAQHDPARERCWIAERDGVNVGSVFLVRKSDDVAKLRLLIVEPAARGLRHRPPSGRRVHRLRPRGRLSRHHAMDQRHPAGGARDLSAGRLSSGRKQPAPRLRPALCR